MSRAIVPVVVVLSLIIGQNIALLCSSWCAPSQTAPGCQHQGALPSTVGSAGHCDIVAAGTIATSREDEKRGTMARNVQPAAVIPRLFFGTLPVGATTETVSRHWLLAARPLTIALRI